jgi:hypothetical protein
MAKKSTKTTKAEDKKNGAFNVKLTEEQLAECIAKKMSLEDICAKFDVKPGTVRTKFARLMAKEKNLDSFFVTTKSPRLPSVQKNHKFTVSANYVDFMGWKPGSKLDIVTDADQGQIVIKLAS